MLACHQEAEGRRSSPEVHQEHVLNLLQDLQLPEHVANLVPFDALLLVHVLHGIHLLSVSLLHNAHLKDSKSGEKDTRFSKTFCILTAALLSCINRFQSHLLSDDRVPHKPSAGQGAGCTRFGSASPGTLTGPGAQLDSPTAISFGAAPRGSSDSRRHCSYQGNYF